MPSTGSPPRASLNAWAPTNLPSRPEPRAEGDRLVLSPERSPAIPTQQALSVPCPKRSEFGHSSTPPIGSPKAESCLLERVRFPAGPPVGGSRRGRAQCRLWSITHWTQIAQGPRVEIPVFAQLWSPPHLKQRRSCFAVNASSAALRTSAGWRFRRWLPVGRRRRERNASPVIVRWGKTRPTSRDRLRLPAMLDDPRAKRAQGG